MKISSRADLHLHTYYSDGTLSPAELLYKARRNNLSIISITDHDNLLAIKEALKLAPQYSMEIIPGVEISSDIEGFEVHILGYFIDTSHKELNKYLSFFREERYYRAKRMLKNLKMLGMELDIKDVLEKCTNNSSIGRPHIATALLEKGYVKNYYEAFDKYLAENAPAYEKKIHMSPQSAIKLISEAGGLSFVAHPKHMKEEMLISLIKCGLDGVETIHPSHNSSQSKFYKKLAAQYYLLESGGSDFHGGKKGDEQNLGKYYISEREVENMKRMLLKMKT